MLRAGDKAPAFELPDLQGQRYRVPDGRGQQGPTLVVFWKTSCNTCDLAFPYLQRLAEAYPSDRWQLLAVSQDDEGASADFARRHKLAIPILIEGEGWPVSRQYDPEATPTFFLIGPDGAIELTSIGFDKWELNDISRRVAEHLGEAPQAIAGDDDGNPRFKPG